MLRFYILLYFIFLGSFSYSQILEKIKSIQLRSIDKVSYDRYYNIYVSDLEGNITKYNKEGDSLLSYSPIKPGNITSLEAWNSIRIFAFYKDFQQFTLFDRFLGPLPKIDLPEELTGFGRVATVSADNQIWIFDDSEFSLKKYDIERLTLISKTNCDLILNANDYDIIMLKEYQNQLYIIDKINGILIFDNFGNFKKKILEKNIDYVAFYKDELYYLNKDELLFLNLYLGDKRSIKLPSEYNKVIMGEKYLYLFSKDKIDLFILR